MGLIKYVKEEIAVIRERDPAIKSNMEVFLYPTFHAILKYRLAHKFYKKGHYFWARWISQRTARKTGIEIHPGATIGKGTLYRSRHRGSDRRDCGPGRQCNPVSGSDSGRHRERAWEGAILRWRTM